MGDVRSKPWGIAATDATPTDATGGWCRELGGSTTPDADSSLAAAGWRNELGGFIRQARLVLLPLACPRRGSVPASDSSEDDGKQRFIASLLADN